MWILTPLEARSKPKAETEPLEHVDFVSFEEISLQNQNRALELDTLNPFIL